MKRRIVGPFLSIAVGGCSTGGTDRPGSTTQPATAVPVQIPSDASPALPNSDAFDTALSPVTAAQVIAGVYKDFDFNGISPPDARGFATLCATCSRESSKRPRA